MTRKTSSYRLPVAHLPAHLPHATWIQIVRTHAKMQRLLEQSLSRRGITLPQFDVLATLAVADNITQQDLAECLLVTKGNICLLLDRMQTAGWVSRRPDAGDKRANRLFLTTQGKKLAASLYPNHLEIMHRAMAPLHPGELQTLFQLLDRLEQSVDLM